MTSFLEHVGARIAHELKNPLAAIKGLVQLVQRGLPEPHAGDLGDVLADLQRVEEMIDALTSDLAAETPSAATSVEAARVAADLLPLLAAMSSGVAASLAVTAAPRPAERLQVVAAEISRLQEIVGQYAEGVV